MKKTSKKDAKCTNEAFGDGRINIDLSNKKGAVTKIIKDAFPLFKDLENNPETRTKEAVVELCHQLFDDAGLDTQWTRQFFYNMEKLHGFESAMNYISNIYLKGANLGMDRGKMYREDDEDAEKTNESNACKYTKKQITEAIAYWKKQLKKMNEDHNLETINDARLTFDKLCS